VDKKDELTSREDVAVMTI